MVSIIKIEKSDKELIAKLLNCGKIMILPTETVYGLCAVADNENGINKIYEIKKRENKKPLSVFVENIEQLDKFVHLDNQSIKILQKFTPGPLTIILKQKENNIISSNINVHNNTIGIRIPDHQFILDLLKIIGKPLISTSVNFSGQDSATNIAMIDQKLLNMVDLAVDDGESRSGIASTIIDFSQGDVKILREGAIKREDILRILS